MADLLTNRGFRAFWIANLISNLGTSAFVLAINWLTVKQYGALGIATLALAYGVPPTSCCCRWWGAPSATGSTAAICLRSPKRRCC